MTIVGRIGGLARGLACLLLMAFGLVSIVATGGGSPEARPEPLAILAQPADQSVLDGSLATFTVVARSATSYRWQVLRSGTWTDLPGATGASYTVPAVEAVNGLQVRVIVADASTSITSRAATLTVTQTVVPASIVTPPQATTVNAGTDAVFTVVAGGTSPSFRWQTSRDGAAWTDVPGATTATLVLPAVPESDSGRLYRVVVANTAASVTSAPVALTVVVEFRVISGGAACGGGGCGGDSGDGSGVGSGADGGDGAGGGLSALRNVTAVAYKPDGTILGRADVGADHLVSLYPVIYRGAFILRFADNGSGDGEYFDEGQRRWLKLGSQVLRVMVPDLSHHVSANPATEAAYQWAVAQAGGAESALTAASMRAANERVRLQLNARLPTAFQTNDITNFAIPINDSSGTGTLGNTWAGRFSAVLAAMPIASANLTPSLAAPALAFARQLALDIGDDGNFNVSAGSSESAYDATVNERLGTGICTAVGIWGAPVLSTAPTLGSVSGELTLLAGNVGGNGNCDGWGPNARFNYPNGISIDAADNLYVADTANHTLRKVTPAGAVSTHAGLSGSTGSTDGARTAARFRSPMDTAALADGTVYVADYENHTIRRVGPDGVVTTFAGSAGVPGAVDATGAAARFRRPVSLAVDGAGNVYVADIGNRLVRKITPAGVVSTLAGGTITDPPVDGTGAGASFGFYFGLTASADGTVWVGDQTAIRRISAAGVVTTIAGSFTASGTADGTGAAAQFRSALNPALAPNGDVVIADQGSHTIRRITPAGVVSTIAGRAGVQGSADGPALQATFKQPADVAVDRVGNVFVLEYGNFTVRRLSTAGTVSTFAGSPKVLGSQDGSGTAAQFYFVNGIARDSAGNVYAIEFGNSTLRRITPAGASSTVAGSALLTGAIDGTGSAARFAFPQGLAIDAAGNLYVADTENSVIRRVTPTGVVSTYAGAAGQTGSTDGTLASARFDRPRGIAIDAQGNLYISDTRNRTIRKIFVAGGQVITLAGTAGVSGSADGIGAAAQFGGGGASLYYGPEHLAVDPAGYVYVADIANRTVRKISPAGEVSTLAGLAGQAGTSDGTGSAARFNSPRGLAVDDAGSLYVTDGERIRRVDTGTGAVSTVVGRAGSVGFLLGPLPATLGASLSVAVINRKQIVIGSDSAIYIATFP